MSISGVRRRRTTDDRADDALKSGEDSYIHKAKRHTDKARQETGNAGPGAISGPSTPGASFLPISGKYGMLGSLAFNPVTVAIQDGRINIAPNQNEGNRDSSYLLVTGQGSPDELRYVDGASKNGQMLKMQGTETQIIIIKHALLNAISNISGLITVTVVTTTDHGYVTGEKINIVGTTNFNVSDVEITVTNPTTFTYSAIGNVLPETAGITQNGNILTDDGEDLTLDASIFPNAIPMAEFEFDPTVEGFGAWREQSRSGSGGGTGGLTEPVIFGINTLTPQTLPTKTTIAWNTNNPQQITLDRAVEFEFTSLPPSGSYEGILVIIDINGTGGFASPIWPPSLANPPLIPTTPSTRFSVMLYTTDGGTIVTHATSVGSSSGGAGDVVGPASATDNALVRFDGTTGKIIQNSGILINDSDAISGVTGITMTGATATISAVNKIDFDGTTSNIVGLQLLNLFQADQQIESTSSGIMYMVGVLQSHLFKSQSTNIARFEEAAANVFRLDMLDHAIKDARDITFSNASGATIFAGTSPAIGFDSVASRLIINMPTGANLFVTNNNVFGTTQINNNSIAANIILASDVLQLGVDVTVPSVVGEFRNDGTDVFTFSGGLVRNFSNIPTTVAANTELSNLTTPTLINTSLISDTADTDDLGSELIPWRIAHVRQVQFDTTSSSPTGSSDTQISRTAALSMEFNAAGAGIYNFFFAGINVWSLSSTLLTSSGAGILIDRSLTFNDSTTNPVGDGELTRNGDSVILQSPAFQIQRVTTGTFSGDFNLTKVDAAPSGGEPIYKINFALFDSPTTTIYSQIRAEIRDVTDAGRLYLSVRADNVSLVDAIEIIGDDNNLQSFMNIISRISSNLVFGVESGVTDLKIFPALNALGIVVQDNVSFTVGSLGTNAIPISATLPSTAVQADGLFGNHKGAEGMFDNGSGTLTKFIRQADGNWGSEVGWTRDALT